MHPGGRSSAERVVKSAERTLDILELLAASGREMTHGEIAQRLALPKSSLTHLLRGLTRRGYVATTHPGEGAFRLGESALALARRGVRVRELLVIAQPVVEKVTRSTGESAALSLLRDNMVERVCAAHSRRARLYSMHVGVRAPLYAHSAGKVFLAWMKPAEREAYLSTTTLEALTPHTLRSAGVLRRQLGTVRSEGVGWSFSEFTEGVVGISVPVFDVRHRLIATVGVALPETRFDEARARTTVDVLRSAAAAIGEGIKG